MSNLPIDHDTRWKVLITILFEDFVAFFLPHVYELVDWTKPVESLDQELYELVADKFKGGTVINDKLFKVHLKGGKEQLLLIHIEVQSSYEANFQERMFVYFYRIFDRRGKIVTALGVFTSDLLPKDYNRYEYNLLGTKAIYEYNTYCVKHAAEEELLTSSNPFAIAVLAAKYLNKSKRKDDLRYDYKRKLFRLAAERNYSRDKIRAMFQFIHLLLVLPADLEQKFLIEMKDTYQIERPKFNEFEKKRAAMLGDAMFEVLYGQNMAETLAIKLEEGKKRVIEEVAQKGQEAVKNMLKMTDLSVEQIAAIQGISKQEVLDIQANMDDK